MNVNAAGERVLDPSGCDALIVDLDGVVTRTAAQHAEAWKRAFDELNELRRRRGESPFTPFDKHRDYPAHVDGKPRLDGVRDFLADRGLSLPEGDDADGLEEETIRGVGNRKNELFHQLLKEQRVDVFEDAREMLREARERGFRIAVVSSSRNCREILEAAELTWLFDVRVDGEDLTSGELRGKPAPDLFLEAARRLDVDPERAVVFEDSIAGVEAGAKGDFRAVVGVDRVGHAEALREHGADLVASDLRALIDLDGHIPSGEAPPRPSALDAIEEIRERLVDGTPMVFLDYDGTLTPIVERPELAVLSGRMRDAIRALAGVCRVAIVSGRDRPDVEKRVGLEELFYAGSHGFDISGPDGWNVEHAAGGERLPELDAAEAQLNQSLRDIAGARVERKRFAIAVHFRACAEKDIDAVERAVDDAHASHPSLRKTTGKKVYELQPDVDWDKGRALRWILRAVGLAGKNPAPLYIGDDLTDEDAFRAIARDGVSIVVGAGRRSSAAQFELRDVGEVERFLRKLTELLPEEGSREPPA